MIETVLVDGDHYIRPARNKYTADSFITETHKQCSWCDEIKPHTDFHKDKKNLYGKGLAYYCKECANAKTRAHHEKYKDSPEYQKRKHNSYYKRNYNLTVDERFEILKSQEHKCAICELPLEAKGGHTHTDHSHTTGKVRGILCTNCNRGIGHFQESQKIMARAIEYLQAHTEDGNQKEGRRL